MVVINLQIGFSSLGANGVFFSNSRLNSSNIHGVSISQKPICGMVLGSAGVRKSWAFCFRRPKFGIINALPEDDVETNSTSSRLLEKEFRFSPTFDEYIKVLESVKTNRSRILNEERDVHALKKNSVRRDARFTEKRDLSKSKKHLCKEKFYSEEKARYSEHARGNAPNQKSGVAEKSGSAWALVEGVLEKKAKEKRAERQSGCLESRSEDFDSGRNALYKKTKGAEKVVNQDGTFEKKRTSQRRPEEPRENWQKLRRLDELESSSVVKNELGRGYNGKPQFTPYRADEDLNGQRNGLHKKSNGSEEVIDDEILENRRMSQRRLKETEEYRKELRSLDELKSTNFARDELGCGDYRKSNHSKRLRYGGSNEGTMVSQTEGYTFAKIVGKNGSSLRFDNMNAKDKPRISRIEAVGMEENQHNQAINAKERNVYTSAKEIYHKDSNRSNAKFHGDMREGYTFAKIVGKDGSSLRFDNMNAKGQPRRGKIEAVGMEGNLHNQAINAKERNMYTSAKEVYHKGNNRSNAKCHGDMIEAEKLNSTALISSGRPGRTVVSYPDVSKRERDDVTLENRAAFRTFEVFTDVRNRSRVLRMEMEERIRDLAKWLNASDLNMPEWQFSKMIHSAKIKFSEHSILRIVQILGSFGNWRRVLQVIEWFHSRERFKYYKSRYIYTTALDVLGKAKRPMEALNIFYAMRQELSSYPDLAAYHCIAVTLGQAGLMKELFDVIDLMRAAPVKKFDLGPLQKWDPRLEPDVVVYNAVLNACVQQKQWEGAFWVLQELKEQGIRPSSTTYGLIMEVMLACGKYNLVHEFFRKLQKNSIPGALNYKVLVNTLWREGRVEEAVQAVKDMERRGIVGCASLYYDLARCLCSAGRCEEALHQINKICKVAKKPLVVTYTGLIQACLDSGNIENAAYIFNQMTSFCSPNVITCNIMLKSYVEHEMFEEAKDLFQKILSGSPEINRKDESSQKVLPDKFTFNTMIEACTAESKWDDFEYSYREMLHHGYHFDERRHMRLVFDAWRAGKKNILEITWDHLTGNGRVPPPSIIKELFCMKMEEDEPVSAVAFITIHQDMEIEAFSEKSWLNLLERKAQHISSKALARLVHELRSIISESTRPHPVYQNLLSACKQFASRLRGEDLILLCKPEESS